MIQRIQSLYLLLAAILMGLMVFMPISQVMGDTNEFMLRAFGMEVLGADGNQVVVQTLPMGILIVLSALLPLVTIFLYKNRVLQIRLCAAEMVLLLGAQIFAIYMTFRAVKSMEMFEVTAMNLKLGMFMPIISMVFVWLALRGITKDIKLVKSLDRIR